MQDTLAFSLRECCLVYFRKGKYHLYVVAYIECFLIAICSTAFLQNFREGGEFFPSFLIALKLSAYFLSGVYSSLLVYRSFFLPLNRFPGSFGARISNFWLPFTLGARHGFRQIQRLHDNHGSFVRLGPNYISITHPKACTKAAWYDMSKPMRHRVWSTGFSDRALRAYEKRMQIYQHKLFDNIVSLNGQPINVTKWFNLYSFDFMGDLAYGKSFKTLENQYYGAIKLLNGAIELIDFCARQLERRLNTPTAIPDITSALSAPLKGKKLTDKEWDLLQELMPPMDPSGVVLNEKIANLKHLNAVINETLCGRPPPEGLVIDEIFIPGDTTVICPQYDPNEFVPERWMTCPEMIQEKSAFALFSTGPYGRIGKPLALLNI
ncbi:cytochrome P450 [Aspergillus alliaceus]|uniref:Cytochrome P450 n=1 Tax=Petromyces alliaceus TaxID=209559 RepID=A0A5N7BZ39_PETAA|nr:cytochrome P450 [Aspergillus alliaceus]